MSHRQTLESLIGLTVCVRDANDTIRPFIGELNWSGSSRLPFIVRTENGYGIRFSSHQVYNIEGEIITLYGKSANGKLK